ncbi:MAG: hypothetical protein UY85_C0067G0001, partial [Candidatus Peribacteria bacterium GW2011_GWB1_54_5]
HTLGRRCLSGIYMRDNPDIAYVLEIHGIEG